MKKYVAPIIVVRGTIEEITQGSGWGIRDFFVFRNHRRHRKYGPR
jgi:hypothetical protein